MPGKHTRMTPDGVGVWYADRLWAAAEGLPEFRMPIADIPEFDKNCWFDAAPTIREVTRHFQRIRDADLRYPVIFAADGGLMDGGHRIAKAWLAGETEIRAVRFEQTPEPDFILPEGMTYTEWKAQQKPEPSA